MKKRTTLCSYSASEDTENTFMNVHDWIVTSFISINDLKKENKKKRSAFQCHPINEFYSIGMNANDEIISECFGFFEKINMTNVE